jgi:exonuclease SbcC
VSITRVEIFNFQSLKHADLDLGVFTVIVGPSSSGKSALIRAFKALASNVRGAGVITRGQKAMAITARTETHTVTLERTERSGSYKIADADGTNLTFTKLAGEVPEQVTQVLRIDPVTDGQSVNFASQFDKPYLLDESGATVARVLGELTNVTTVFEAVRQANRVRAQAASTLKTRNNDLEQVKTRLGQFQGLSDRLKALAEAEQLDAERRDCEDSIARLENMLRTVRHASRAIEQAAVPEVPAPDRLNQLLTQYLDLQAKLRGIASKRSSVARLNEDVARWTADEDHYRTTLADLLAETGVCPTCGQEVH